MNRKIAIIIERADIALGGAERSVFELRAALSALRYEVDILAAKGKANAKRIHVLCENHPGKRMNFFAFEKELKKFLPENKYDIIHSVLPFDFSDVYQPRGGSYAETIIRNATSYQNKFIKFYKNLTAVTNTRRTALLRAERKLAQASNGPVIAALSQYVAEQFKQHYNTSPQRIVIIPNGVKTDMPSHAKQADNFRSQILAKLKLKEADNPVLLLFVANNFRLKGLPTLIKAMQIAEKKHSQRQAYLLIAGHGKAKKYQQLVKSNNIVFLGPLSHIHYALSIIDIAVLPTFYDPSSRFILEALAAGKPVITTRYNGACDLFTDNRHGKIIDNPEDDEALAETIGFFTDTKNIENASQAIAEDNLREEISICRVAKQLVDVYESILLRKGKN
jgi:UDP-glucose:(heptosyl)LPS alpha-1,3-glucosyltransferase